MNHELAAAMALAFTAGSLLLAAPVGAYDYEQCTQERQCRRASDGELDEMRGGFSIDTAVGRLEIAIGITRAVSVNEQLVAVSQLVLPDANQIVAMARAQAEAAKMSGLAAGQAAAADAAAQASSLGAAATASAAAAALAQASASASGGGNGGAGSSTPPQVVINGVPITPNTPLAASLNKMGGLVVVQNGPGNSVNLPALPVASAMTTIIQNSLDDQVIRSLTLISASVNSLAALRGLALGDLLSRATLSSGR